MRILTIIFVIILLCITGNRSYGQKPQIISGKVIDTLGNAIPDAHISLILSADTLLQKSDISGKFKFQTNRQKDAIIQVKMMGYLSYSASIKLELAKLELSPIVLKLDAIMLKEVQIKDQIQAVRMWQDTIEYNVLAYTVLQGDRLEDLLKQLPGLKLDDMSNVTAMGKRMTKIRVNGKDFFTNNVKDFISRLPADIISKIQIIDDYGNYANFTGIKTGEAEKMLNIVTKPEIQQGQFGEIASQGGTNSMFELRADANLWRKERQIGAKANFNKAENGAGELNSTNIGVNYRNKILKSATTDVDYSLNRTKQDFANSSSTEILNQQGLLNNQIESIGDKQKAEHYFKWGIQEQREALMWDGEVNISSPRSNQHQRSSSVQTGIIQQSIESLNLQNDLQNTISGDFKASKKLTKNRNFLTANLNVSTNDNKIQQQLIDQIQSVSSVFPKVRFDSVFNRNINTKSKERSLATGARYTHSIANKYNPKVTSSIDLGYNISWVNSLTNIDYQARNADNRVLAIDSLSSELERTVSQQVFEIKYNLSKTGLNYSIGLAANINRLSIDYQNNYGTIAGSNVMLAPIFRWSKAFSEKMNMTVNYTGTLENPTPEQLQPVPNIEDLQNIIIGNPKLKPSFAHVINSNINMLNPKSANTLLIGVGLFAVRNPVTSHIIILPDTAQGLKQETRYENTAGIFGLNGNYSYEASIPNSKLRVILEGNIGLSQGLALIDYHKYRSRLISINQNLVGTIRLNNFIVDLGANFMLNTTGYKFNTIESRTSKVWDINFSSRANFNKGYKVEIKAIKRINTGYLLAQANPLLISMKVSKSFFKQTPLKVMIGVNDLLDQGNNISRTIIGNVLTDRRTNQATQFFTLGASFAIEKF